MSMLLDVMEEIKQNKIDIMTVKLSSYQKMSLMKVASAVTSKVAHDTVTTGKKMSAATRQLEVLNLIDVTDGTATLTRQGITYAQQTNLLDEYEELTNDGKKWAYLIITEDSVHRMHQASIIIDDDEYDTRRYQYMEDVVAEIERIGRYTVPNVSQDIVCNIVESAFMQEPDFDKLLSSSKTATTIINSNILQL